ncbi:MAG: hypothetical protein IKF71_05850 [Bacilli bacterium]|nr:hypothetical protein [Bacilli bacterium]
MDAIDKITIGNEDSNIPRRLFMSLFNSFYQKCNKNYEATIYKMTDTFCTTSRKNMEEKNAVMMYILSKYAELNHYRDSLGTLDNDDDDSLWMIEQLKKEEPIQITPTILEEMINDTLYYLFSTNKLFQQNAINCAIKDGLHKKLYHICPTLLLEHMNTLMEDFSEKELLLESIQEAITITYDKRTNKHPKPKDKIDFLKKIRFPSTFHQNVLAQYNSQLGITEEENDRKVLISEMIFSVLNKKEKASNLSFGEYRLLHSLKQYPKTKEGLSQFYNDHGIEIMNYFITNMDHFETLKKEGILEDQPEFFDAKQK